MDKSKIVMRSHHFGREAVCLGGADWRYADNMQPIPDVAPHPCGLCGKHEAENGHDPCIANLPGVAFACCGHGVEEGYVKFENGLILRGQFDHVAALKRWKGGDDA